MSLISDALKKAEQQRSDPSLASVNRWTTTSPAAAPAQPETRRSSLYLANVVALVAVCAFAIYFFRGRPGPFDGFSSDRAGGSSESVTAAVDTSAPTPTPDARPGSTTVEPATPSEPALVAVNTSRSAPPTSSDYDLVGTSGVGSTTLLSIARREDKRSLWVPVGRTVAEVTAVSYDPETDRAVIRVRGNLMTVVTREASSAPAPAAQAAE